MTRRSRATCRSRRASPVHDRYGDRHGNLVYEQSKQNFNPAVHPRTAHHYRQVEELLEPGQLDPMDVHPWHLPAARRACRVRRVRRQKRIEKRTVSRADA